MNLWGKILLSCILCISIPGFSQDSCGEARLGEISFSQNSAKLTKAAKSNLNNMIAAMKNAPGCAIYIITHNPGMCENCGPLSWDRGHAIAKFLERKKLPNLILYTNKPSGNLHHLSVVLNKF